MKYETIGSLTLPKIGFGTWKIGGGSTANPAQDKQSLAALHSALALGYTHFDTAEMYANGHAEELLGQAIRQTGINRQKLFITSKFLPSHWRYDQVLRACEGSLRRLGMDYLDLYLIHWHTPGMHLPDTFRALNQLVAQGRVRHLGVSNFDLKRLQQSQSLAQTPLLTNQVPYSLSDRSYAHNGVLQFCQENNILFTAYSPVEEGNLKISSTLQTIAQAHAATPYQIALAWVIARQRIITIPMSANPKHQAENLAVAGIQLTEAEIYQLDQLG